VIHVYAFTENRRALPTVEGLDGAPLEARTIGGIETVMSRRRRGTTTETLQVDALAHGGVVEALVDLADAVLPVRFGDAPQEEDELERAVRERAGELRRALDRVRGCVEVGLRLTTPASTNGRRAASGTEYIRKLQATDAFGAARRAELRTFARDARATPTGAAYLVPRAELGHVREAVERFVRAQPTYAVLCTGPWAPYSFAVEGS
jgi:hypothetical protein